MTKPHITPFQKRVYKEVSKIPCGQTRSYKQIADKLKTSPRAIGQALKKNPFAPKIACHRVIKADGTLGGYSGKMNSKKKRELLKEEGVEI